LFAFPDELEPFLCRYLFYWSFHGRAQNLSDHPAKCSYKSLGHHLLLCKCYVIEIFMMVRYWTQLSWSFWPIINDPDKWISWSLSVTKLHLIKLITLITLPLIHIQVKIHSKEWTLFQNKNKWWPIPMICHHCSVALTVVALYKIFSHREFCAFMLESPVK
jgi:hypothetical protein